MSLSPYRIAGPTVLAVTATALGTVVPPSTTVVVKRATVVNYTSAIRNLNVWVSRSAAGTTNANLVISDYKLAADGSGSNTYSCPELSNLVLGPGDQIFANTDQAAAVNITISGIIVTGSV